MENRNYLEIKLTTDAAAIFWTVTVKILNKSTYLNGYLLRPTCSGVDERTVEDFIRTQVQVRRIHTRNKIGHIFTYVYWHDVGRERNKGKGPFHLFEWIATP